MSSAIAILAFPQGADYRRGIGLDAAPPKDLLAVAHDVVIHLQPLAPPHLTLDGLHHDVVQRLSVFLHAFRLVQEFRRKTNRQRPTRSHCFTSLTSVYVQPSHDTTSAT